MEAREGSEDSLITKQMRDCIGVRGPVIQLPEEISASDIRRFVEATGDTNRLWLDEAYARSFGYRGRVVPPMMVLELWRRINQQEAVKADPSNNLPLPENYKVTRNAGSEVEWVEPVYLGDRLSIQERTTDIRVRRGRAGLGIYISRETEIRNQEGTVVVRKTQIMAKFPESNFSVEKGNQ